MDATATPQNSTAAEFEAIKRTLAARDAENHSLRQALDARNAELAARNSAYSERIEHQAATIDVLKAMSASPGEARPVFDLITRRALQLCNGDAVGLFEYDGEQIHFRAAAAAGPVDPGKLGAISSAFPMRPSRETTVGRVILDRQILHLRDMQTEPGLWRALVAMGFRSQIALPLLREGVPVGAITLNSRTPDGLSDSQIELLKTFAEQAVIAIRSAETFRALEQRTRDLSESLEQQTATAEVLQVISRSAFDLQTVLDTLIESAVRLCSAGQGTVFLRDGELFRVRAVAGAVPGLLEFLQKNPIRPGPETVTGRVAVTGTVQYIIDISSDPDYNDPGFIEHGASRSLLGVPLLRDGQVEGVLLLNRLETLPFTPRHIDLASTFADQAVIAIENARLFETVQERTRDLAESLEYQTATSDVLKVISSSSFDLTPVFQAVVATAVRLCRADQASIYRFHEGEYRWVAGHSLSAEYERIEREVRIRPGTGTLVGRVALQASTVQILDAWTDPLYEVKSDARVGGVHTMMGVPLLRDGVPIGVIALARRRVEPYEQRQVDLITTFADQAVIAIENARLFEELQTRTRELASSVAELQALEEVLRAVNSSLDLDTLLATIINRAVQLSHADEGMIYEFDDGERVFVPKAASGMSDDRIARLRERRIGIGETYLGRSAAERAPVHIADVQQDRSTPEARELLEGIHAVLAVPLLRDDKVIGGLVIRRRSEGAFEGSTVKLLETFAAQSVIAIANARLFDEVQTKTRELTAALELQTSTADVLKAISRTAFELDTVLTTLIETALRLCNASAGQIFRREGDVYRHAAVHLNIDIDTEYLEHEKRACIRADRSTLVGRVALEKRTVLIDDAWNDPDYGEKNEARLGKIRAMLGVPLMRDGEPIGAFALVREVPVPFTPREVELVTTFADQAVIAIENVRLFDEVQARTNELTKSLHDLRAAQDRLIQTEKLASLGQLTAGIAHEIKNPLNFVNNFSALSVELIDELLTALAPAPLEPAARAEVDEITELLRGNIQKVVQHGKRADGIVRNMLLHAREGSGERRLVDFNATVEEALNLAYHGARAEKPGFNVILERHYDPAAGSLELYPQEFARVLLNLIGNGFYAVDRRRRDGGDAAYSPTLTVTTEAQPDALIVRVRDNGTGIPDAVKARLFEPFFTTKPAGEGTGLGLSISHDIVVKQHGGSIAVDSRPGEYTEFTITLPRTTAGAPA